MTEPTLEQLTHEQLIQTVTERLGEPRPNDLAVSLYLRSQNVPVVRIHPYPKRRRTPAPSVQLEPIRIPSLPDDIRYADFLRDPELSPVLASAEGLRAAEGLQAAG